MDQQELRTLAEAGGICERCGGAHTPRADQAILAQAAGLDACDCDCPVCAPFRQALEQLNGSDPEQEDNGDE